MSRTSGNAHNSVTRRGLELPSIEVTHEDESSFENRSNQSQMPTSQILERRLRGGRTLLISRRGAMSTIPHLFAGLSLIATGSILKNLLNATDVYPQSSPQLVMRTPNTSLQPAIGSTNSENGEDVLPPHHLLSIPRALLLEEQCQALTCNPYLSLICITVGCMFILCGLSGGMMMFHRMKEYVCCHLLWLSVSALCSITLAAACVMDVKSAYEKSRGLIECVCIVIAASLMEALFCAVDFCFVSHQFSAIGGYNGLLRVGSGRFNSVSSDSRGSSRRQIEQRNTNSRRQHAANSEHAVVGGGGRRQQERPSAPETNSGRNNQESANSSRSSRSGQAVRGRNSLHPGYHHQHSRNRARRRPILRAQNHYVLVPAAYGRSRVSSRVLRTHTGERRNRMNMPMFVIANHDRYVQALNRSMETLETEPNRGSVPGDVFPSRIVHEQKPTRSIQPTQEEKTLLEKADSLETTLSTSSMESSKVIQNSSGNDQPPLTPVHTKPDPHANQAVVVKFRGRTRDRSGYSIVRRAENGMKFSTENATENKDSSELPSSVTSASSWTSHQKALAQKLGRAASVVEDSVFQHVGFGNQRSSQCETATDYSAMPAVQKRGIDAPRTRLYNTSSEGDFAAINTASSATPRRDRICHASVSSDSGIAEASHVGVSKMLAGPTSRHYHNLPMDASQRVSLEMRDFTASNPQFPLSPVSPNTPSYENVNAQMGALHDQENFVFTTNIDCSVSAEDEDSG